MSRFTRLAAAILGALCLPLAATSVQAQRPGLGRGQPRYDTTTVTTIEGRLLSVDTIAGPRGYSAVRLSLLAGPRDTVVVHAGPGWYLAQQGGTYAAGEQVKVMGSRTTVAGARVMLAAEITRNGKTIRLRDRAGTPQWSRRGNGAAAQPRRP